MAKVVASCWILMAVLVAQCTSRVVDEHVRAGHPLDITLCTSRVVDEHVRAGHPLDITLNDELQDYEHLFIENFEDTNPAKVGDKDLFEADILLSEEQWEALRARKAIPYSSYRWTEASDGFPYVPYVFQDSIDQNDVRAGINHWMEHTCIKFGETTNTSQPHIQFHIGSGCWSYIGMRYWVNGQQISIGSGCNSLGVVVHEIGHAIGFYHEQSRSDRDDYVVINADSIRPGYEGNFRSATTDNFSVIYDYSSDMHYSGRGFTTDGRFTIATKDFLAQELIGSRSGLSHRDTLLANRMYGCLDKWLASCGISSDQCQNEGYIGANCNCTCPVHTSGTNCQIVNDEYYANLRNSKTEVIRTERTISVNVEGGNKFTKHIIAPECTTPKLTFQTFNLYPKSSFSNGYTYCYYEYLNIRTDGDISAGNVFCDTEISSGQVFTSSTQEMVLFTESYYYGSSAWSAQLTFDVVPGCQSTQSTYTASMSTTPAPVILKCKSKKEKTQVTYGETVIFRSRNYPQNYPKKTKCGWILKKPSDGVFVINCDDFEVQPRSGNGRCDKDFLKIAGKKYCGVTGPDNATFNANKLYMNFVSNRKKQFRGFSCTATVVFASHSTGSLH